jgi:hypothetical protein
VIYIAAAPTRVKGKNERGENKVTVRKEIINGPRRPGTGHKNNPKKAIIGMNEAFRQPGKKR